MQAGGRRFDPAQLHQFKYAVESRQQSDSPTDAILGHFRARRCGAAATVFFNKMESRKGARHRLSTMSQVIVWVCCTSALLCNPDVLGLYGQANKRIRWMPWRQEAMKDVVSCEKLRGAAKQALIRRCPNGETRPRSCSVTRH